MLRPAAIAGVEPTLLTPEEVSSRTRNSGLNANSWPSGEPIVLYQQQAMSQNGSIAMHAEYPAPTEADVDMLYPEPPEKSKKSSEDPLPSDISRGLYSPRAFLFLMLWYLFSAFTLFQNKYILTTLPGDPTMLSEYDYSQELYTGIYLYLI